jgi:hypothetical protein
MPSREPTDRDFADEIVRRLEPPPGQVVRLFAGGAITPDTAEYVDLIRGKALGRTVKAIVEKDGNPLLYVAQIEGEDQGPQLARLLANRAETAALLACTPDRVDVAALYACRLDSEIGRTDISLADDGQVKRILGDLQEGLWATTKGAYLEQSLRDLLVNSVSTVSDHLRGTHAVLSDAGTNPVLALVGRALFVRFLIDREILTDSTAPNLWRKLGGDWTLAFANPANAAATCRWLDDTFNGEFMPLARTSGYASFFETIAAANPEALTPLSWILARTEAGGQLPMWDRLDFSYIPAGTLSEVYEAYAHRESRRHAKQTSVHFTPRHIARMMVRQALMALPEQNRAAAKVLDPAVGAGVFLSVAYRELAKASASATGRWPDSKELRDILYSQLRGMDINADALNLGALTLYLTAIELDANPLPPEKLRFKRSIVDNVLFSVAAAGELGSLAKGDPGGAGWDVVVGNPPWSSLSGSADESEDDTHSALEVAADVSDAQTGAANPNGSPPDAFLDSINTLARGTLKAREVGNPHLYRHPDRVPDLAFVWKACEWARPGGVISFVLHHRILIKRTPNWRNARQSLFAALQVDGILNASEFANHKELLWPGVEAPFCVLFARNQSPPPAHRIRMITLAVEPVLKVRRQIRLDPGASMWLSPRDFEAKPAGIIPRILGSAYDQNLLESWIERTQLVAGQMDPERFLELPQLPMIPLEAYLTQISRAPARRGIKFGDKGARTVDWMARLPPETRWLDSREAVRGEVKAAALVDHYVLQPQKSGPPTQEWFTPPLLLMRQAMGKPGSMARALLVTPDKGDSLVAYPFAYLGTPIANTKKAIADAAYLALCLNSSVFAYYATLTSTQFAFGHKTLLNEDLQSFPVVPRAWAIARRLTTDLEIGTLFDALGRGQLDPRELDAWVARVMQLDEFDQAVIRDTLSVSYPIANGRQSGTAWVSATTFDAYVREMKSELEGADERLDVSTIRSLAAPALPGWRFVTFRASTQGSGEAVAQLEALNEMHLMRLVRTCYPAGQLWGATKRGEWVFGQLALQRLWLPSRAPIAAEAVLTIFDQLRV